MSPTFRDPTRSTTYQPYNPPEDGTMNRLLTKLTTRRCRGCDDTSVHTHHLTLLGRWRFIWRHQEWRNWGTRA